MSYSFVNPSGRGQLEASKAFVKTGIARPRKQIVESRGAFECLPVLCANDLCHGAWWWVWGSAVSTLIPGVPLLDMYFPFFRVPDPTAVKVTAFGYMSLWVLLIAVGFFFTLGSIFFVRAFDRPEIPPFFGKCSRHLQTDELVAAWCFLIGALPSVPYVIVFLRTDLYSLFYWGGLVAAFLFVIASYMFVYATYPTDKKRTPVLYPCLAGIFGNDCRFLKKHCGTDWLLTTWVFFFGSVVWAAGSAYFLYYCFMEGNDRDTYIYGSSLLDAVLFTIGCAYFCAGSYDESLQKQIEEGDGIRNDEEEGEGEGNNNTTTTNNNNKEKKSQKKKKMTKEKKKKHESEPHHVTFDVATMDVKVAMNDDDGGL